MMKMTLPVALMLFDVQTEAGSTARSYLKNLPDESVDQLLVQLEKGDNELKRRCIAALAVVQSDRAFEALVLTFWRWRHLAIEVAQALAVYGEKGLPVIRMIVEQGRWSESERDVLLDAAAKCGPKAAELLITQQTGDGNRVCERALLGYGSPAVDVLINGLGHPDHRVIEFCRNVLVKMTDHAGDAVIKLALEGPNEIARLYAIETLGYFPRDQERVIRTLMAILEQVNAADVASHKPKRARLRLVRQLIGRSGPPTVDPEEFRIRAAYALATIAEHPGDSRATVEVRPPTFMAVPVLCNEALPLVMRLLTGSLKDETATQMQDALKCLVAWIALADYGSTTRYALAGMLRSENTALRKAGADIVALAARRLSQRAMPEYSGSNPVYRLAGALNAADRSPSAREFARRSLNGLALLIPLLQELLRDKDEDEQVLAAALEALGRFGKPALQATSELLAHMRNGRAEAFAALKKIRPWNKETIDALRAALSGAQASLALDLLAAYGEVAAELAPEVARLAESSLSPEVFTTLSKIDPTKSVLSACIS